MSTATTTSLFEISHTAQIPAEFSQEEYSRLKYGDDIVAEKWGPLLARKFICKVLEPLGEDNIPRLAVTTCRAALPTAASMVETYFVRELNRWLATRRQPQPPAIQTVINRIPKTPVAAEKASLAMCSPINVESNLIFFSIQSSSKTASNASTGPALALVHAADYAGMTREQRKLELAGDELQFDREFVGNRMIVWLDDVRVTGALEDSVRALLESTGNRSAFTYLVKFAGEVGTKSPVIERDMNEVALGKNGGILGLRALVVDGERFVFNQRFVKRVLKEQDRARFEAMLEWTLGTDGQQGGFAQALLDAANSEGFYLSEAFKTNYCILKDFVQPRDAEVREKEDTENDEDKC